MASRDGGERLTAADASNVVFDAVDQVNVFLLAGLLGAGGFVSASGDIDLDRVRTDIGTRLRDPELPELSRFSQHVVERAGRLVWDRVEPDLSWHIRLAEPVDGLAGLGDLAASLMLRQLPADRPGWELLVVPGAGDATPGVILRAHHAIADGVAGVRLAELLFGDATTGTPARERPRPPRTQQSRRGRLRRLVTGAVRVSALLRRAVPPTVLLGPISPRRSVGFSEVDLAALGAAARSAGGTLNDALLAGVSAAVPAALRARDHPVPMCLPVSVPVALSDRAGSGNATGVMMVPLPTDEPDVRARVARIAATTTAAKAEARAAGTYELTRSRWGSRAFAWLARRQRFVVLFVTNVRGPATGLAISGAPVTDAWPVTPIQGNVRVGVAALSYRGRLACTVHADADVVDAALVAQAIAAEMKLLVSGVGTTARA